MTYCIVSRETWDVLNEYSTMAEALRDPDYLKDPIAHEIVMFDGDATFTAIERPELRAKMEIELLKRNVSC